MKKFTTALTAVAIGAACSGVILAGAGSALAQGTPPPWVGGDQNAIGGLTFYDASGHVITSGRTDTAPFAAYVQGNTTIRDGDSVPNMFGYSPQPGVTPDIWSNDEILGLSANYPNPSAPGALATSTLPLNSGTSQDLSLDTFASDYPNTSTLAGYQNVYEIRLMTNAPGDSALPQYDYADLLVDPQAHTWSLLYTPDAPTTATTSTLGASSTSVNQGDTVTLTDTITPAAATGTVQFKDGGNDVGSPVTVSGGTASTTEVMSTSGPHSITAEFTPADGSGFGASTSNAVSIDVAHVVSNTMVALAANPTSGPAFSPVTLTATPSPAIAGTVKFFDAGQQIGTANTTGGPASITYSGFAEGDHNNITASFTPTNSADFNSSTSDPVDFNASAPTGPAPDEQTIDADVAPGSLSITTPYDPSNPLHVGTLALNGTGTELSGTATFGDPSSQDGSIKVVDTRAGDANWTASAASSDLTDGHGNSINQQNVGLTDLHGIYTPNNAIQSLSFTDNPAAEPAAAPGDSGTAGLGGGAHAFAATTTGGDGTVGIYGTLTINAPTSTQAGHYTGTVTFTVA